LPPLNRLSIEEAVNLFQKLSPRLFGEAEEEKDDEEEKVKEVV
jgi:hypothetical protein